MSQKVQKAPKGDSQSRQGFASIEADTRKAADALAAMSGKPERPAPSGSVRSDCPIDQLAECPFNPRTGYDQTKIDELAASIRQVGLLEPLVVRLRPSRKAGADEVYEVVCGHRRLRAAKLAGLKEIPIELRDLDDATVLEIQLVENVQRADLSPIEEAKGYRRMIDVHKLRPEEVAERVGISRSSVYERLRLLDLPETARSAVVDGRLSASTAALLVRIVDPKARDRAAAEILAGDPRESADGDGKKGPREPLSFRQARALVRDEYLLELDGAGFDMKDLELVVKAGACTVCPKRTGNMKESGELLGDLRPNVCTDAGCFRSKLEAHWIRRTAEHEAAGGKVMPDSKAKGLFYPQGLQLRHDAKFVDLEAKPHDYSVGLEGRKTWRQVLKSADVPVTLARHPSGRVFELVPSDAAEKVAKASKPKPKKGAVNASDARFAAQRRREGKAAKLALAKRRAILRAFHDRPSSDWPKDPKSGVAIARALGAVLGIESGAEAHTELLKIEAPDKAKGREGNPWDASEKARKALRARLGSESATEAVRTALELALSCALLRDRNVFGPEGPAAVDMILKLAGLHRKKIEATVPENEKPTKAAKSTKKAIDRLVRKVQALGAKKSRKGARGKA